MIYIISYIYIYIEREREILTGLEAYKRQCFFTLNLLASFVVCIFRVVHFGGAHFGVAYFLGGLFWGCLFLEWFISWVVQV